MRVLCNMNEKDARTTGLTVGQTYLVVEVVISAGASRNDEALMFRLSADDDGVPALYEAFWFDVTDTTLPATWAFNPEDAAGSYVMGPRSFATAGYWELYFENDETARGTFAAEVKAMQQS